MRFLQFIAAAWLALVCAIATAHAEKRVALVIGNAAYRNADKLANPVDDARSMRGALAGLGFDVTYGEDLDQSGLRRAIGQFADRVSGADVALVYFAGHGATFGDTPYVVPVDAEFSSLSEVSYELVSLETLIGELRRAQGVRIAILDACRDNAAERALKRRAAAVRGGEVTRGLGPMKNPDGLILAYATQYLSTAADNAGSGHSPFTAALLKNIATPGLDVKEVFFNVGQEVVAATEGRQRPEISVSIYDRYALVPTGKPEPVRPIAPQTPQGPATNLVPAPIDPARFDAQHNDPPAFGKPASTGQPENSEIAALPPPTDPPLIRELPKPHTAGETCSSRSHAHGVDRYCASSVLSGQQGNSYGVGHLFDGDRAAAWVEGASGQGIGEWITVEFDAARLVRSIAIDNGYQKNTDIFYKNSRVSRMTVIFSGGERRALSLQDQFGQQTFSLDRPVRARWIQFVIDDVYPGSRYQDTAISKLSVATQ